MRSSIPSSSRYQAIVSRIAAETADAPADADAAVARLRGVGLGYIDFALAEPGWFELALLTFDPGGEAPSVVLRTAHEEEARFLYEVRLTEAPWWSVFHHCTE